MAILDDDNLILKVQTVQITPFKVLITALKDIIIQPNIYFSKEGIKIINMDRSHTVMVHLMLYADRFEEFFCKYDQIITGINMMYLFKLISTLDNQDTLTIFIEKEDYCDGIVSYLGLLFENGEINQYKLQKLRLMDRDNNELEIPSVEFTSIINFPATDFQKIIRDLTQISDKIEICSVTNSNYSELIFKTVGESHFFATSKIVRGESENNMKYKKQENDTIIQGVFSLKTLGFFTKCTNLCNQIEIYLANDKPLIIKYNVASLGEIKLALSPLEELVENSDENFY